MDTLTATVPFATFTFDFDPLLHLGGNGVRLETLGVAGAVLAALVLAALTAGRTPLDGHHLPTWAPADDTHLRRDDLLFIVLGIVPGAVIGGRLGYVLLHLDFYSLNGGAIVDPSQGSLELGIGVVGGLLTGAYVARLLDAPIGRWLHAVTGPVFLAIALGELARVLGGSGQGGPAGDGWTTAYAGPGPWGSLAPAIPAHPAQVFGALVALLALFAVLGVRSVGGFRSHDGSSFFVALLIWALGRAVVSVMWRDDPVVGPIPTGGLLALGIALGAVGGVFLTRWAAARERNQAHGLGPGAIESGPIVAASGTARASLVDLRETDAADHDADSPDLDAAEHDAAEPESAEPSAAHPDVVDLAPAEPGVTDPELADPDAAATAPAEPGRHDAVPPPPA